MEVRDARTGKDLTRAVLTQIVVEDARSPEGGLPTNVLHQLRHGVRPRYQRVSRVVSE